MNSTTKITKRKRVTKCANCSIENPSHNYSNCPKPCQLCQKDDHKTRSCSYYRIKNRNKRHHPNPEPNPEPEPEPDNDDNPTSNAENNDSDRRIRETENVLSKNGVFALAAMTSAATFPSNFKSIEVQKYQIKFKTINGFEGTINLHTDEREVRNVREEFQNVGINYVNQDTEHTMTNGIKYSIEPKKSIPKGGLNKIKRVGEFLSQAKYYKNVMPMKIPLRKTDISPADWRVEKYVSWERNKNVSNTSEIELDETQSSSFTGSIYDDPPNVNVVINRWKRGKNRTTTYYFNPPQVPDWDRDNEDLLSDYIEYLSEGLRFIQYNNEINRRSELRYCSYLDKAVEIYRQNTQPAAPRNDILKIFLSESTDNSNKDRTYLCKKKMVGKRLNKIIDQCQLNWHIIDCVEELSTNFLTNTVQEENLNTLIDEINKEYVPLFSKKKSIGETKERISQRVKARLSKIRDLNIPNIEAQIEKLKGTDVQWEVLYEFDKLAKNSESDILEDEYEFENLNLEEEDEFTIEFTEIIEERKEILSRLGEILKNAEESSENAEGSSSKLS